MTLQLCEHGRRSDGYVPCVDCDNVEWQRVRWWTVLGSIALLLVIFVPLVLLLCGVFW